MREHIPELSDVWGLARTRKAPILSEPPTTQGELDRAPRKTETNLKLGNNSWMRRRPFNFDKPSKENWRIHLSSRSRYRVNLHPKLRSRMGRHVSDSTWEFFTLNWQRLRSECGGKCPVHLFSTFATWVLRTVSSSAIVVHPRTTLRCFTMVWHARLEKHRTTDTFTSVEKSCISPVS